jgi:hypothetical protein
MSLLTSLFFLAVENETALGLTGGGAPDGDVKPKELRSSGGRCQ